MAYMSAYYTEYGKLFPYGKLLGRIVFKKRLFIHVRNGKSKRSWETVVCSP